MEPQRNKKIGEGNKTIDDHGLVDGESSFGCRTPLQTVHDFPNRLFKTRHLKNHTHTSIRLIGHIYIAIR